jgi:cytochrome c556
MPGRIVAHPGQALESPPGEGDYTAEQSLANIRKEPTIFSAFAQVLQQSSLSALHAIEARDADKLLEAGGDIDAACEQCHRRFWYPTVAGVAPSSH